MTVLPADVALFAIDLQPDLILGGALACEHGRALLEAAALLLAGSC